VNVSCDVYFLEIYNPKSSVNPQPHTYYLIEYKQGLPCPLFCLLVMFHFIVLLATMNESTLYRLKKEAKEKELTKKAESIRK
jgi:hypothetical protein